MRVIIEYRAASGELIQHVAKIRKIADHAGGRAAYNIVFYDASGQPNLGARITGYKLESVWDLVARGIALMLTGHERLPPRE